MTDIIETENSGYGPRPLSLIFVFLKCMKIDMQIVMMMMMWIGVDGSSSSNLSNGMIKSSFCEGEKKSEKPVKQIKCYI
ncbi:hypothetical protein DERP_012813 [Dermatophagoides pteronyssinus]|uniref:Uncharacterized protein n=1 Tax=Dermatophagoides pteronyssinus TaxID=6956 RepID=A0ABQ8JFT1_DERPT|nr:hypothetical protein DERP_012813 [Dermatophagoides pteronyssinus]